METSYLIARYMGPVMLVAGLSFFVNRQNFRAIFEDFMGSPALIFVGGVLALVLGLTLVTFHNRWVAGWPVLITVYGWLALAAGCFRILTPSLVKTMGTAMMRHDRILVMAGAFNVLLGAFFTYMGFVA